MEAYTGLAQVYDTFMDNVPYDEWGEYLVSLLKKYGVEEGLVLDMGCGTGILSILAAKLGASTVTGIDIDEWSYRNARENIENNQLQNIQIKIGNAGLLEKEKEFDFILANINRNILLTDMPFYERCLKDGGILIMSGFYTQDLPSIRQKAAELGMTYGDQKMKQNWVAVSFTKNKQFVEL